MWHLGSNVDAQRAFDGLAPEEQEVPLWQYQLATRYMSERDFDQAVSAFQRAEQLPELFMSGRIFRIYALGLAGRVDEARDLAREAYPQLASESRLEGWWDFFAATYGIDPRPSS